MNKILKSIFLIIISLGFLVGIVNAQNYPPFYVKFTDADRNGKIEFNLTGLACGGCHDGRIAHTGVATTDHTTIYDPLLQIPQGENSTSTGFNSTFVSWEVEPGESLIYDVYIYFTFTNSTYQSDYYWTSQGYATSFEYDGNVTISWILYHPYSFYKYANMTEIFEPTSGDDIQTIQTTAVPIPSALWLLGSGAITLGLIRKKLLTR
ncbi:MAG: hypothetical protein MW689_001566 [Thermodesulfobacteria bacterium]|nr:hypothetical protein [Thermodesulfobacteriota bacterium]MCU4137995.1 hypothetical protein [Thermodesulfobacteriota bacterium]